MIIKGAINVKTWGQNVPAGRNNNVFHPGAATCLDSQRAGGGGVERRWRRRQEPDHIRDLDQDKESGFSGFSVEHNREQWEFYSLRNNIRMFISFYSFLDS